MKPTTVLVVDDDPMVRAGLSMILSADESISVVAEAADGAAAIARARSHRPDVALMDLQMPGMDGIEATRRIHADTRIPVLMLTTFHLDGHVIDALSAGATGYLLKDVAPQELCRSIHLAAAGESVFSATITRQLIARHDATADEGARVDAVRRTLSRLTDRERTVAEAVAEGAANATIAQALFMSESTVKTHISRILAKTGLDNRVQLALMVFRVQLAGPADR